MARHWPVFTNISSATELGLSIPLTSFRQSTERALSAIPSPSFPENTVGDGSTSITWLQDVFFLKFQVRDTRSAVQSFSTYPPGLIPREDRNPAPLRIVGNSSPVDTAQCRRRLESSYFFVILRSAGLVCICGYAAVITGWNLFVVSLTRYLRRTVCGVECKEISEE